MTGSGDNESGPWCLGPPRMPSPGLHEATDCQCASVVGMCLECSPPPASSLPMGMCQRLSSQASVPGKNVLLPSSCLGPCELWI